MEVTDVLVEGETIKKIAPTTRAHGSQVNVIDCAGKTISPGFIGTHHRFWQTQRKGRHAGELLLDYMLAGECCSDARTHMHPALMTRSR